MRSATPPMPSYASSVPSGGPLQSASILSLYFEASLYLLLLTSVLTLVSTGKLDIFTTIAAPVALIVKGFRRWRGHGPELSARAATICFVIYFAYAPFDYFWARSRASDAPNPALYAALLTTVHLMLFAMAVRLYSARTRRDSVFLAMLAFASMLSAAVLTVDTAFLVFFLVFLALGISTFIGLEIERGAEGAVTSPVETSGAKGRKAARSLAATSVGVAISAMMLGGLLFLLLPRFTTGYFGSYGLKPKLMTGFTETVELGQIGEIQKSTAVVMRIKVAGSPERFMSQRWRGIALARFDGWRWSALPGDRKRVYADENGWFFLSNARNVYASNPLSYRVLLEPVASDAVFVVPGAGIVRGKFSASSGLGDAARRNYLLVDGAGSIFNPFPTYSELSYDAYSQPVAATPADLRAVGSDYPEDIQSTYLQIPDLDPRIPALAKEAIAGAETPYDKAVVLENYLRTHFGYTLDLMGTPGNDPLANFLFVRRAGHCEYFATAMTVMLRTLGIPARYINGFQTGEYNNIGGDFIVRASDAHSWVEAYFPGNGWITFDPTPGGENAPRGWTASIGKYWDWLALKWDEWVINYDFLHQVSLAQGAGRGAHEWAASARARFEHLHESIVRRMRLWQFHAQNWPGTPFAIAAIAAALALLAGGKPLRKRLATWWILRSPATGVLSAERASEHYSEMLRLLERRGLCKAEGTTALEFATSIPQMELAAPVGRLTDLYQSARFGDAAVEPRRSVELLREIRQKLSELGRKRS
jgi:transglutaminase-like putative cysteine protease